MERLGGTSRHSGSVAASLHRGWIALKAAVTGRDALTIVAACGTGEIAASADYEEVTNSVVLRSETKSIIENQQRAIDESRLLLREIHQELVSAGRLQQLEVPPRRPE